jgi:T-complex protein 1 subunit alpha
LNAAKTSMSSKLLGSESDFYADIVVKAMQRVKQVNALGEVKCAIKSVHILKTHGKSSKESTLVDGYAIEAGRSAQGMPTLVENAKIACIDFNLNRFRL